MLAFPFTSVNLLVYFLDAYLKFQYLALYYIAFAQIVRALVTFTFYKMLICKKNL